MTFSSFEHIDVKMDGAASPYGTTPRDALAVKIADVRPDAAKRPNGIGSKLSLPAGRSPRAPISWSSLKFLFFFSLWSIYQLVLRMAVLGELLGLAGRLNTFYPLIILTSNSTSTSHCLPLLLSCLDSLPLFL